MDDYYYDNFVCVCGGGGFSILVVKLFLTYYTYFDF